MTPPLARLRHLGCVRRYAIRAAELDSTGQLGSVGLALLRAVRQMALAVGCVAEDVDEMTMAGCVAGRGEMG